MPNGQEQEFFKLRGQSKDPTQSASSHYHGPSAPNFSIAQFSAQRLTYRGSHEFRRRFSAETARAAQAVDPYSGLGRTGGKPAAGPGLAVRDCLADYLGTVGA